MASYWWLLSVDSKILICVSLLSVIIAFIAWNRLAWVRVRVTIVQVLKNGISLILEVSDLIINSWSVSILWNNHDVSRPKKACTQIGESPGLKSLVLVICKLETLLHKVLGSECVWCVPVDLRLVRYFLNFLWKFPAWVASGLVPLRIMIKNYIHRFFRITLEVISIGSFDHDQWEMDLHSWTIELGVMGLRCDWVLLRWLRE